MIEKIMQQQLCKCIYEDINISKRYILDNKGETFPKMLSKCAFLDKCTWDGKAQCLDPKMITVIKAGLLHYDILESAVIQ